jgi:hypothetical protein
MGVIFAGEQGQDLQFLPIILRLLQIRQDFCGGGIILLFRGKFGQGGEIIGSFQQRLPGLDGAFAAADLGEDFLRGGGIRPEIRDFGLRLQRGNLFFLAG